MDVFAAQIFKREKETDEVSQVFPTFNDFDKRGWEGSDQSRENLLKDAKKHLVEKNKTYVVYYFAKKDTGELATIRGTFNEPNTIKDYFKIPKEQTDETIAKKLKPLIRKILRRKTI